MTHEAGENVALQKLDAVRQMLAEVRDIGDAKKIRDQAEAIRVYGKQQQYSVECINYCSEIKLRAERKIGEMSAALEKRERFGSAIHDGSQNKRETLRAAGIEPTHVSRWEKIATLPVAKFEATIQAIKSASQRLTTNIMLKEALVYTRKAKISGPAGFETCTVDDLNKLVRDGKKFGTIYADPPWLYGNQATRSSTGNHYDGMTISEIAALPIKELVSENAHLHLWTTNGFIFECKAIMEAWGFEYKSCFVWVKPELGIGNYWRLSHEFMLFGLRGKAPFQDHSLKSWLEHERGQHSAKPEAIRKMVEKASVGPRLELFGRRVADGWTVWGNQISRGMFDTEIESIQ
jgi:N6-adenosine-specific RNA methylase IME4